MASDRPILIAGGGPVGMIMAWALARQNIAVHVLEAEARVNDSPRAATTHAATLEMLDDLSLVDEVTRRGLIEPKFRIWDRAGRKLIVEFDFGVLRNDTRFPYVVQCEQHKLANMTIERLRSHPHACVEFSARVTAVEQFDDRVEVVVDTASGARKLTGSYLVVHRNMYNVHQPVAASFRKARVFLAGDAAHVNNPLGGLGLNFGIHDAIELAALIGRVLRQQAPEAILDQYDQWRRPLNIEYVQQQTIANKKRLEEKDPAVRAKNNEALRMTAADPVAHRAYLLRASLIESVRNRLSVDIGD